MRRTRSRAALAIAVACGLAISLVQTAVPGQGARDLLPDARPVAPFEAQVVVAENKKEQA